MIAILIFALFLMLSLFRISSYAFNTYDNLNEMPHNKVGLLLGTSPTYSSGEPNEYFTYRIMAAVELYNARKIDYILVSGDNRHESYNEPRQMQRSLIKAGVDPDKIIFDFAGMSTLDSIIRANKVFLQQKFTIISQEFHNERALFIADNNGINAIGYNALNPNEGKFFTKVGIREIFARIKCILDVYFLNTQPHFLGDPITIGSAPSPKEISNTPRYATSKIKLASDSAKTLKEKALKEQERVLNKEELAHEQELERMADKGKDQSDLAASPDDEILQARFYEEERRQALEESSMVAKESLSSGNQTYIDPNEKIEEEPQVKKSHPKRRIRKDIKTFNGDPWDYY